MSENNPFHYEDLEETVSPEKLEMRYLTQQIKIRVMKLEFMLKEAAEMIGRYEDRSMENVLDELHQLWVSAREQAKGV